MPQTTHMDFNLSKSLEILQRTPDTLFAILQGISSDWTHTNEGDDTWSVYDIIGHLIHGEKTDWIPRIEIMLSDNKDKTFESFDRFAQFEESKDKTLAALLAEFKSLREKNIKSLQSFHHVPIMDDLVPHIDGRAPFEQSALHDLDRPVHARAEAARACKQDREGASGGAGGGGGGAVGRGHGG